MEKLIACCGLNCATCDARIATGNNDDALREATAGKWRVKYNEARITAAMINCTGCRVEGVKFNHCFQCENRKCADTKGFITCAECAELDTCPTIAGVHKFVPEALENLKNLN